jgi:CheY-like chemotaxis protein
LAELNENHGKKTPLLVILDFRNDHATVGKWLSAFKCLESSTRVRVLGLRGKEAAATPAEQAALPVQMLEQPISRHSIQTALKLLSDTSEAGMPLATSRESSDPATKRASKILVVDDNDVNRLLATTILSRHGYETEVAHSGWLAVSMIKESRFALVLMDVQMPGIDGLEATKHIRRLPGARALTPIVAMTANAMPGDRERCLAAGMDDYLSKPINASLLIDIAEQYCGRCDAAPVPGTGTQECPKADGSTTAAEPHTADGGPFSQIMSVLDDIEQAAIV